MRIEVTVYGNPVPERKRQVPARGNFPGARVDTPEAKTFKEHVRAAMLEVRPSEPLEGPLALTIIAYRQRPKGAPKRIEWPTTRPDLTNYVKIVEDCGNGLLWRDDAQICDQRSSKRFGAPRVEVIVETLETVETV